ncbi:MAG: O-antigen ligase family protein [Sporomusaceae bacterium]|nr:O-antigen ligase family protein [Sporomusaceae bacterium]
MTTPTLSETETCFNSLTACCLLGTAFFLPISLDIFSAFLFAAAALWAGKMAAARKILWKKTPLDKIIAVYVFFTALSILNSPDRNFSFYNYYNLMGKYILTYYLLINNVNSLKQLTLFVRTLLASATLVIFYGFYQYFAGVDVSALLWVDASQFPGLKTRIFSTLGNPNLLASFLVIILSLYLSLSFYAKRKSAKFCLLSLTVAAGFCLALTYSRGLWLSLLATTFIYAKFYDKRIIWVLIPILAVIPFGGEEFAARAASIINPADSSSALRLALWNSTLCMILKEPLAGIGWGAYWLVYPQFDYFINDASVIIYHAHNMYLNIAAETGLPGLLAFLAVLGSHIRLAFQVFSQTGNKWTKGLMLGVLASMTGIIVSGFTDYVLFSAQMSMLFWLLNAVVIISWLLHSSHQAKKCEGSLL